MTGCEYATQCSAPPAPPLTHVPFTSTSLPYTGAEIVFFVGLAVAIVAFGLLLRYSERIR